MDNEESVAFGYRRVAPGEKARLVDAVFSSVAGRYDLMNDLMSGGLHRLWKRCAVELIGVRAGQWVLDLAGGSGDMAALLAPRAAPGGRVVLADINREMLERGRDRLTDRGLAAAVDFARVDAARLPFADGAFDRVCIAFGLRNVADQRAALGEMRRVLRPGGRAVILEFSQLAVRAPWLRRLYDAYSLRVLPALGQLVVGDGDSYRYLAESIRTHPGQEELLEMMREAGFEDCDYHNLSAGIVAVHRGFRT